MANALTLQELNTLISTYAEYAYANGINRPNDPNITDFLTKCALMFTLPHNYKSDVFRDILGSTLPTGGYTEEYFIDPTAAVDFDETGATTLAPHDPTKRAVYRAMSLKPKTIPTSVRLLADYKKFTSPNALSSYLNTILKQWMGSRDIWLDLVARQTMENAIKLIQQNIFGTTTTFAANTNYKVGTYLRSASSGSTIHYGVVYTEIPASGGPTTWDNAVSQGYIVLLDNMQTKVANPVDVDTGAKFILQLQNDVDQMIYPTQGYSLSGNILGTDASLVLYIKADVMNSIGVETLAGAFHRDTLLMPADIRKVPYFGEGVDKDTIALLCDKRAIKVHNQFELTLEQTNAQGAFINHFWHYAPLCRVAGNVFMKTYKKSA